LGRGLEALLGPATVDIARAEGSLTELDVSAIRPNPFQPRHAFDDQQLDELAKSMNASGLLQPIVVREAPDTGFELIAGERRWRAAQRLGWERIGAVVREADDRAVLTFALVENLQRDALSPIDEARGYGRLVEEFGLSHADVGGIVGRSRSAVANALRLLSLPDDVQAMVHGGVLSAGHARALLGLDADGVSAIAKAIVDRGLSVREVESLVRNRMKSRRKKGDVVRDPQVRRVEDTLRRRLQTDVTVSQRGKDSGKIGINFYSHDDLARILEIVLGEPYEG
jgi:ParB family chromosome partitioning protein